MTTRELQYDTCKMMVRSGLVFKYNLKNGGSLAKITSTYRDESGIVVCRVSLDGSKRLQKYTRSLIALWIMDGDLLPQEGGK